MSLSFDASSDFVEYTVACDKAPASILGSGNNDCHVLWQGRQFVGTVWIQKVEVIEVTPDEPIVEPTWTNILNENGVYGSLLGKQQGLEVLYSETGTNISDFKLLQPLNDAVDTEWNLAYVTLPATARHFAIHHNKASHLGYGLKIDDITYNSLTAIDHFRIYVDGRLVGTSQTASYSINEPLEAGKHRIAVTAVFADGTETIPAYASLTYLPTAIDDVLQSGQPFDVFTVDGKLLRSNTRSIDGLHGVYVIGGKSVILK